MSARRSTGVILIATGSIGIFVGFMLSVTAIGAICGVPMIIVCIPLIVWGYLMKAKDQEIKDEQLSERMLLTQAVASGINICPQCKSPTPNTNPTCNGCGYQFTRIGNSQPISVVDPAQVALRSKQVKEVTNFAEPIIEDEHW